MRDFVSYFNWRDELSIILGLLNIYGVTLYIICRGFLATPHGNLIYGYTKCGFLGFVFVSFFFGVCVGEVIAVLVQRFFLLLNLPS